MSLNIYRYVMCWEVHLRVGFQFQFIVNLKRREFRLCWRVTLSNECTLACHCWQLHNRFCSITLNKRRDHVFTQWIGVCVNKNNIVYCLFVLFFTNAEAFWNILSEVSPSKDMADQGPLTDTAGNETPKILTITNTIHITFPYKVLYNRPDTRYHLHWTRGILINNLWQWFMFTSMSLFTYCYFILDVKAEETQSANEDRASPPDERKRGETEGKIFKQGQS